MRGILRRKINSREMTDSFHLEYRGHGEYKLTEEEMERREDKEGEI